MRIALMAGEASGDQLGAALMQSLRKIDDRIIFDGVGGELMQAQGLDSLLPMEDFSVMGISEILKSLPRLLRYKKHLIKHYQRYRPDVFVGIDYPEFNISMQKSLKSIGVHTVQYVSPSVWAWREKRIDRIKSSTDLMLTLFDFEKQFYDRHQMPAVYCGHPLVDMIPPTADVLPARLALGIDCATEYYLAILPGSRVSEVNKMLPVFIETIKHLKQRLSNLALLIPAATPMLGKIIEETLEFANMDVPYQLFIGQGKTVMQASDAVLLASGTAALEAMLLKKPMAVAYKVSGLTGMLAKRLVRLPYFSLPNLLAGEAFVPEFMQDDIDPVNMAEALHQLLVAGEPRETMITGFSGLREKLPAGAADVAARALYDSVSQRMAV